MEINMSTERRPAYVHRVRERVNSLVYSHIVFALIALVVAWIVIRSNPNYTVMTMLMVFGFLFLLLVFEAYSEKRVISTRLLNGLTVIAAVLLVAALSVCGTFIFAGQT